MQSLIAAGSKIILWHLPQIVLYVDMDLCLLHGKTKIESRQKNLFLDKKDPTKIFDSTYLIFPN